MALHELASKGWAPNVNQVILSKLAKTTVWYSTCSAEASMGVIDRMIIYCVFCIVCGINSFSNYTHEIAKCDVDN